MTGALRHHMAVCPGCVAAPSEAIEDVQEHARLAVSLPTIHCQACISTVERGLSALPGVEDARVNLTLKRAFVEAAPDVSIAILIETCESLGFEAHELDLSALTATQTDRAGRELLMRLAVAGFAMMNVMLLSISVWSGASDATRDMFHWISALITFPAIVFSAQPFFRNAWSALRVRRLNMDVPIVLALILALLTSLWEVSLSGEHAYFDAALALVFFLLAGRYLDHRTRAVARSAAEELTALEVPRALRLDNGQAHEVSIADLAVGDHILVRPGGRVPVDGKIIAGQSEVDRALLTGETLPVFASVGQMLSAGEVNLTGPLTVVATAVGKETSLHRLADLVAIAESGRSQYTSLADRAAKLYAPGVHIISLVAFLGWYIGTGDLRIALNIAAAVLIITCPCALGLAVPAVTTAASGRLFKSGLLIKHATALERLAQVDTVVFDKTGTLTEGMPELVNIDDIPKADRPLILSMALSSAHPLSLSLVRTLRDAGYVPVPIDTVFEHPGFGVEALYQGQRIRLGRAQWVGAMEGAETTSWFQYGDASPVALQFADSLRAGAVSTVQVLKDAGKRVVLLSGDSEVMVQSFARRLEIPQWHGAVSPQDKAAFVQGLSKAGHNVLMVGDGLNDTAALAAAHVSMSPATALDAARVASDIVLLGEDLAPIAQACEIAISARRRIRENFRIATLYNVIAVPLAAAGGATPLIAALAMSSSSLTVSLNALRLRGRPS